MIEAYKFGKIKIDGRAYDYDVEVRWDGQVLKWWRKESHQVVLEDIRRALEAEPEKIIFGTGEPGLMQVSEKVKDELKSQGIEIIIDKTEQAVKTFNLIGSKSKEEEGSQKKVIGLFHLTC